MTDAEITALAQAVERLLANHEIHLGTDRFNDLCSYLTDLVADIKENGE